MKKFKSMVLFAAIFVSLTLLFCFNASAAEWADRESGIKYNFDEDTAITTIRGENGIVSRTAFGWVCEEHYNTYLNDEVCEVCTTGSFEAEWYDFSETNQAASRAANGTKILIIEDGVKSIDVMALHHFKKAEVIILPESITEIPAGAFSELKNLKTVVLSNSTAKIGDAAFFGCANLKNIVIPKTVKTIGDYAFKGCDFDYVKIPDTVKSVGEGNSLTPAVLKEVKVTKTADTSVTLDWDEVKDANGYRVFVSENGKWKKIADTFDTGYQITNLNANKKYVFAVRPFNALDLKVSVSQGSYKYSYSKLVWSPKFVKITVTTAPANPDVRVASTAKGRATIAWNNVAGETGYQVWYSTKQYGTYKKVSNYKVNTVKAYKTGFTSGKTYYFKVRAYKKVDGGYIYSNFSSAKALKIK